MDPSPFGISLIIPAYNRAGLISATLDAALRQRNPFAEIIVVDDGSTDDTHAEVARFSADNLRLIRTANFGVQSARNTGARAARSEWLAFCDSDDLLDMDYVSVISDWLRTRSRIDLLYCNFSTFGARPVYPDKLFALPEGFLSYDLLDDGFYVNIPDLYIKEIRSPFTWPTGMMIKRERYLSIGGFNPIFNGCATEDWEFHLRAIQVSNVAVSRRVLARVRYHEGSQSSDGIRVLLGAQQSLGHALAEHVGAKPYAAEILNVIADHTQRAFDAAFAAGRYDLALEAVKSKYFTANANATKAKASILRLAPPLRAFFWYLSTNLSRFKRLK